MGGGSCQLGLIRWVEVRNGGDKPGSLVILTPPAAALEQGIDQVAEGSARPTVTCSKIKTIKESRKVMESQGRARAA